jgi:hypothetical protein
MNTNLLAGGAFEIDTFGITPANFLAGLFVVAFVVVGASCG